MDQESLLRYLRGTASDDEKIAIMQWMDESPGHFKELQQLRKLYDLHIWQGIAADHQSQHHSSAKNNPGWRRIIVEVAKIAAVMLITLLIYQAYTEKRTSATATLMQSVYVPAGQRAELTLADGTRVWLNANSRLTFPDKFTNESRLVSLDGEGFFEVAKNLQIPFVVKTDKYNVKVWGTKFDLLAYKQSKQFEASLLEGSVEIIHPNSDKGIMLKPNDRIYLDNNQLVLSKINHYNYFLWKDGLICFDNESFDEMVKKLELYFDLKIEVKNESINHYRCTGKFRTKDGIDHILRVLQLSNRFNFKIDEKQNVIIID